jgi:PAT family beta-lactamase induction signal transducer AmpG
MAATYQLGYRIALLAAGAGVLYGADLAGWPFSYCGMAALTLVGIATVLFIAEPTTARDDSAILREARVIRFVARSAHMHARRRAAIAWLIGAVVCPFVDFFARNGTLAILILLFVSLFRLSDITMGVMAYPFYIDLGFSKSEIAAVVKFFGFFMTILGALLGGVLIARYGIMRPLLLGAVLIAATNLLFAGLATVGRDLTFLTLVISADNMTGGFAGTVFIAYLSSLTNTAYTATQYALFSSLMTLPGKLLGGASGAIVDSYGYVEFFIYASLVGLPAIILVLVLMARSAGVAAPPEAAPAPRKDAG